MSNFNNAFSNEKKTNFLSGNANIFKYIITSVREYRN